MSNNHEVTVRAPSYGHAVDFALAQHPTAEVISVGQIPEVPQPTVETEETEEEE